MRTSNTHTKFLLQQTKLIDLLFTTYVCIDRVDAVSASHSTPKIYQRPAPRIFQNRECTLKIIAENHSIHSIQLPKNIINQGKGKGFISNEMKYQLRQGEGVITNSSLYQILPGSLDCASCSRIPFRFFNKFFSQVYEHNPSTASLLK